jgi:hypothetical protein
MESLGDVNNGRPKNEDLEKKPTGNEVSSSGEGGLNDPKIINSVLAGQNNESNKDETNGDISEEIDDSEIDEEEDLETETEKSEIGDEEIDSEIEEEDLKTETEESEIGDEEDLETEAEKSEIGNEIEGVTPEKNTQEVNTIQPSENGKEGEGGKNNKKSTEEAAKKAEEEKTLAQKTKEMAIKIAKALAIIAAIAASPTIGGAILMYYLTSKNEEEEKDRMEDIKNIARYRDIVDSGKNNQFKYTEEDMNRARESAGKSLDNISNFASKNGLDEKSISGLKEMKNDIISDKKNEKTAKTNKQINETDPEVKKIANEITKELFDKKNIDGKLNILENGLREVEKENEQKPLIEGKEIEIPQKEVFKEIKTQTIEKQEEIPQDDVQKQGNEETKSTKEEEKVSSKTPTEELDKPFDPTKPKDSKEQIPPEPENKTPNEIADNVIPEIKDNNEGLMLDDLFDKTETVKEGPNSLLEREKEANSTHGEEEIESNDEKETENEVPLEPEPQIDKKNMESNVPVSENKPRKQTEEEEKPKEVNNNVAPVDNNIVSEMTTTPKNTEQKEEPKEQTETEQNREKKTVKPQKETETETTKKSTLTPEIEEQVKGTVKGTEFDKTMVGENIKTETQETTKIVEEVAKKESPEKEGKPLSKSEIMKNYDKARKGNINENGDVGKNGDRLNKDFEDFNNKARKGNINENDTVKDGDKLDKKFQELLKNSDAIQKIKDATKEKASFIGGNNIRHEKGGGGIGIG